jgi:hypothetical protein
LPIFLSDYYRINPVHFIRGSSVHKARLLLAAMMLTFDPRFGSGQELESNTVLPYPTRNDCASTFLSILHTRSGAVDRRGTIGVGQRRTVNGAFRVWLLPR